MRAIFTKTKFFCGLSALILAVAPMQLSAQQSSSDNNGAYMGLGYLDIDVDSLNEEGLELTGDADGFDLLLGYRFTDNLSAEISYRDIDYSIKGSIDGAFYVGIGDVIRDVTGDATVDGITARVLVHGNLDAFNPFIGITYSDVEYKGDVFLEYEGEILSLSLDGNDSETGYIIGADMAASDNLSVRVSYETCGDCDDAIFIGPIYRF